MVWVLLYLLIGVVAGSITAYRDACDPYETGICFVGITLIWPIALIYVVGEQVVWFVGKGLTFVFDELMGRR